MERKRGADDHQDGRDVGDQMYLTRNEIVLAKSAACLQINFPVQLLKCIVDVDTLRNSNCSGNRTPKSTRPWVVAIDPNLLEFIKGQVIDVYGVRPQDEKDVWGNCKIAIDSYCRSEHGKSNLDTKT